MHPVLKKLVSRIISGGQTGADRAALDLAIANGVSHGGWCPTRRRAEDGAIPDCYPVTELPGAGYRQRTKRNVIDSDGNPRLAGRVDATMGLNAAGVDNATPAPWQPPK